MPTISEETIGKLVTPVGATATAFKTLLCNASGAPVLVLGYDGTNYHILKCNASRQLEVVMSGKATDSDKLDGLDSTDFVAAAGDTMTGLLTLSGAPTADLHAATKKYVDDEITAITPIAAVLSRFRAYMSADQTPTANTYTKVNFNTETYDIGADYDTTLYRWTPPEGVVQIKISLLWGSQGANDRLQAIVYKNGASVSGYTIEAPYATAALPTVVHYQGPTNGTDYWEAYCFKETGSGGVVLGNSWGRTWVHFAGMCLSE